MINEIEIITENHTQAKRDYLHRMSVNKVHCMNVAQEFSKDYWDGDRCYGYGGYRYDGRWAKVAKKLIDKYNLNEKSRVLDLGCGMAHLLYEIKKEIGCEVVGVDISSYAKDKSPVGNDIILQDLTKNLELEDKYDLVISVMTLHNFSLSQLSPMLERISKLSTKFYFAVESFRNNAELFNLQCWALTCQSFFSPEDWKFLISKSFDQCDLEFLYFE